MNKKGDLSWGVIVTAIIVVILLIVLVIFFRQQITDLAKGYSNVVEGTTGATQDLNLGNLIEENTPTGEDKKS